jgi:hypothetical protein
MFLGSIKLAKHSPMKPSPEALKPLDGGAAERKKRLPEAFE